MRRRALNPSAPPSTTSAPMSRVRKPPKVTIGEGTDSPPSSNERHRRSSLRHRVSARAVGEGWCDASSIRSRSRWIQRRQFVRRGDNRDRHSNWVSPIPRRRRTNSAPHFREQGFWVWDVAIADRPSTACGKPRRNECGALQQDNGAIQLGQRMGHPVGLPKAIQPPSRLSTGIVRTVMTAAGRRAINPCAGL
ncbi:unnamed protein product [Acanthosepion pharaonis]|uniref:Uncharacterized protein n=1 Tax=Acanthosepion pharaonis TaxID=158019 RepID=A0A812DHY0_ACAPH|nr:unnamed protein product [Sepia pharaonis]